MYRQTKAARSGRRRLLTVSGLLVRGHTRAPCSDSRDVPRHSSSARVRRVREPECEKELCIQHMSDPRARYVRASSIRSIPKQTKAPLDCARRAGSAGICRPGMAPKAEITHCAECTSAKKCEKCPRVSGNMYVAIFIRMVLIDPVDSKTNQMTVGSRAAGRIGRYLQARCGTKSRDNTSC